MKFDKRITSYEEAMADEEIAQYQRNTNEKSLVFFGAPKVVFTPTRKDSNKHYTNGVFSQEQYLSKSQWWFVREAVRMYTNAEIYGPILINLWNTAFLAMYCPRPHLADLSKIEWFADPVSAAADRPIVTSLAKFLRKVSPLFTDEWIRDTDAEYRASTSTEIELLYGKEGFRLAYLEGPSSCMAKRYHEMIAYNGHHPVDAYDMPGMAVAVSRTDSGEINARCVVYVSPTDEKDKRMIRVYGDSCLTTRLQRNGFVYRGLTGLGLRALPANMETRQSGESKPYVVPFVDGPQGQHNSAEAVRQLVHFEGDEHLTLINESQATNINKAALAAGVTRGGLIVTGTGNAEGIGYLTTVSRSITEWTCPVTGVKLDLMKDQLGPMVAVWFNGGPVNAVSSSAIYDRFSIGAHYIEDGKGRTRDILLDPNNSPPVFDHQGSTFVESTAARLALGYAKLHPEYYPDNQNEWHLNWNSSYGRSSESKVLVQQGQYLLKIEDCRKVIDTPEDQLPVTLEGQRPKESWVHKNTPAKQLTRVHSTSLKVALFATSRVHTVKTDTGRVVVPGFHDVVRLIDGTWTFSRNAISKSFMGINLWCRRGQPIGILAANSPAMEKIAANMIEGMQYSTDRLYSSRQVGTDWQSLIWGVVCRSDNSPVFYETRITGGYREYSRYSLLADLTSIRQLLENPGVSDDTKARCRNLVTVFNLLRDDYVARGWENYAIANWGEDRAFWPAGYVTVATVDTSLPAPPAPVVEPATSLVDLAAVSDVAEPEATQALDARPFVESVSAMTDEELEQSVSAMTDEELEQRLFSTTTN